MEKITDSDGHAEPVWGLYSSTLEERVAEVSAHLAGDGTLVVTIDAPGLDGRRLRVNVNANTVFDGTP
jgi:hypothetical protein